MRLGTKPGELSKYPDDDASHPLSRIVAIVEAVVVLAVTVVRAARVVARSMVKAAAFVALLILVHAVLK